MADQSQRVWIIGGGQPSFQFDAVVRESHTSELQVTDNPVETGVVVSDHAFMLPAKLEIEACVGDVWLRMRDAGKGTELKPVNTDFAWLTPAPGEGSGASRSATAYQLMIGLQRSAEPFSVQTGLKLYQNMLITSLSADQDKDTSSSLCFRASLREILRVNTQTIVYPPRAPGKTARQAAPKATSGEKQGEQVTDPAKAQTILKSLLGKDASLDSVKSAVGSLLGLGGG